MARYTTARQYASLNTTADKRAFENAFAQGRQAATRFDSNRALDDSSNDKGPTPRLCCCGRSLPLSPMSMHLTLAILILISQHQNSLQDSCS